MRTIATIACKGGPGKTTLATHLAIGAWRRGRRVLLADSDPQGSSADALAGRPGEGPAVLRCALSGLPEIQFAAARARTEVLVLDTPAGAAEELGCALAVSDLCLIVVRPTFLDLAASARTVEIVRRLRKPAMMVMNQAPVAREGIEPPAVAKALRALELMRLPVAPAIIRARQAWQSALETGRSVEEMFPGTPAARECAELVAFVERFALGAQERRAG